MKVYIAGKITGLSRRKVLKKFKKAARKLKKEGNSVFIPTILPVYDNVSHAEYLHICYSIIDICDVVYFLNDWEQSEGAKLEHSYALNTGKAVAYE